MKNTKEKVADLEAAEARLRRTLNEAVEQEEKLNKELDRATHLRVELVKLRAEFSAERESLPADPNAIVSWRKRFTDAIKEISHACDAIYQRMQKAQRAAEKRNTASEEAEEEKKKK
ncbi:MAG: hypothetical protein Q8P86_01490 [bacterium]|nr:hypothetical protein [bacterium]